LKDADVFVRLYYRQSLLDCPERMLRTAVPQRVGDIALGHPQLDHNRILVATGHNVLVRVLPTILTRRYSAHTSSTGLLHDMLVRAADDVALAAVVGISQNVNIFVRFSIAIIVIVVTRLHTGIADLTGVLASVARMKVDVETINRAGFLAAVAHRTDADGGGASSHAHLPAFATIQRVTVPIHAAITAFSQIGGTAGQTLAIVAKLLKFALVTAATAILGIVIHRQFTTVGHRLIAIIPANITFEELALIHQTFGNRIADGTCRPIWQESLLAAHFREADRSVAGVVHFQQANALFI
jgi:hypothetical protein